MKVVLIQPPVQDFYETDVRLQPIGLCYIKAAVKQRLPESDVIIKDYHSGYGRKTIPLPKELSFLRDYYPAADRSPFSLFHQYYHFGASFDRIAEELKEIRPDIVGISSLFTPYFREAIETARSISKCLDVPVVMGGPHVSEAPETVLSSEAVDFVIRGEGERPFVELLRYLLGDIKIEDVPGLGYKKEGMQFYNPVQENYTVDSLPLPDLSDLPPARYTIASKPLAFMITSRGCPHRCAFCSVHVTFGSTYRRRPVSDIIKEIEQRYQEGYRVIDFEDDNLTFHREAFRELCLRLTEMFPNKEMEFTAMNGTSYMSLDEELLGLMYKAGFSSLNLALVSSDREVCKKINRAHAPDSYAGIVNKAFHAGFRIVSYQILGLPDEGLDSMVRTMAYNTRLPALLGASPFYRTPKAPLSEGLTFSEEDYIRARLSALAPETDSFSRGDIYTLFIAARIINFLKGLELPESAELHELLHRSWENDRIRIGMELLRELKETGTLYFMTSKGKVPNTKFRTGLFMSLIRESGYVTCQNGKEINVRMFG
ncbi:MAG: B12-binding domain-containing radical SAM protein [Nitrospirota bacterium]|nr:B12-binding domain-containing radical SAM protein [Nitrospirota bacterium]